MQLFLVGLVRGGGVVDESISAFETGWEVDWSCSLVLK